MDYSGSRCPACNKKFTEGDDIVVCPICGAPHHRECYQERGECVFEDEHITGKPWAPSKPPSVSRSQQPARPPTPVDTPTESKGPYPNMNDSSSRSPGGRPSYTRLNEQPNGETDRECRSCGSKNPSTNLFCNLCGQFLGDEPPREPASGQQGSPFTQQFDQQMRFDPRFALYGGVAPDAAIGDHTARDVAMYVGKSSSYYVPRFKAMSDTNKTISFSVSAFLFNGFYFLYRKMYLIGILLLVIMLISGIPNILYQKEALQYEMHRLEVGVDESGQPLEPYDAEGMARLERYAVISNRTSWVYFFVSLLTSLVAEKLYYEHSMRKIDKTLKSYPKEDRQQGKCIACEDALTKAGGVSIAAVIVSIVVIVLGVSGYLVYSLFL